MQHTLTSRIFVKLILGVLCVLVIALAAVDYLASRVAERTHIQTLTNELADKCRMLALVPPEELRNEAPEFVAMARAAGGRITLVARNGLVTADSEADPRHMENHSSRPEIRAALGGATGSDARTSNTVGVRFLYVAIPLRDGALRIAVPLKEVDSQVSGIRHQLLAAVAIAFIPGFLVAALFARYVSKRLAGIIDYAGRLARGDFQARLSQSWSRDELGMLTEQLNETGEKLQAMFHQLQAEHAELEKLERIRKDFVINVSHELRTPLASIQGYTETLLDGALHDPEHNVRFLSIIRQNAERLGRLTADLMTLSRIELKTARFQFASYDVNALVEDCIDSIRPLAERKTVTLNFESAPTGADMFCDSEAVHQILTNLLDNALKYTPTGGSITVGARPISEENIEIYVKDTGIGIPEEDQSRLFERFYRVDKARSREMGGTGLGLAIVKHLVRSQGGEVRVESAVGTGSTFIFTLPVHDLGLGEYGVVDEELTTASRVTT